MQYIPYDHNADPWYQFGSAVGNGLSILAENRFQRGASKQKELDEAQRREKEYNGLAGQLQQLGQLYTDPEKNKNDIGLMRWALAGKLGNDFLPDSADGVNQLFQKYSDKAKAMSGFADMNRGKYYNDGFTHLLDVDK